MDNELKSSSLPEPVILAIADDDDSGDDNVFLREHRTGQLELSSRIQRTGDYRASYKRAIHIFDDQQAVSRENIDTPTEPIRTDSDVLLSAKGDLNGYRSSYKKALNTYETTPHGSTKLSSNSLQNKKKEKSSDKTVNNELTRVRPLRHNRSDPVIITYPNEHMTSTKYSSQWSLQSTSDRDLHEENIFPVQLSRQPSLSELRQRRNPNNQGNRAIRTKRIVGKSGDRNLHIINTPKVGTQFLQNLITTMIEQPWRYTLSVLTVSFFLCWLIFAVLLFLVADAHGDFDFHPESGERQNDGSTTCFKGITCFSGFLLLSIETQTSIGFSKRYPNQECPEAIFLMICQLVIGVLLEGAMVGIVYAKMVRPYKRYYEYKFSRYAVICLRDGKLCLVFRVDDPGKTHLIETKLQAVWVEEKRTREGEKNHKHFSELKLENSGKLLVLWPQTVAHIIDRSSPIYDLSAKDLLEKRFEIILSVTGGCTTTGQLAQSRSSYLPKELLWGHRFVNCVTYSNKKEQYVINYDKFDETEEHVTPLCSAKRFEEVVEQLNEYNLDYFNDYVPEFFDLSHSCGTVIENLPERMLPKVVEKLENKQNEQIEAEIQVHQQND